MQDVKSQVFPLVVIVESRMRAQALKGFSDPPGGSQLRIARCVGGQQTIAAQGAVDNPRIVQNKVRLCLRQAQQESQM
ncbi:Uncharacterised protein [Salmonella enterica subsp. diarizonae]|nr:Uncharacterised protein [Salmonella enterica subsp. diarizonae]